MRRVLAVSWEMPPMYGPRAMQVAATLRELPALGWQPTVVCLAPRRGGPHWASDDEWEPIPGVEYRRVPSPQDWWIVRGARRFVPALRDRPDPARLWISRAARAAIDLARADRFAALITFAQPWSDHLVGLRVQRATGLPWLAHFSDPWAASPYATAAQRARWKPMEADVIRGATSVVFITQEAADLTMAAYPAEWRRKVAIVPHGFDPRSTPASNDRAPRARLRLVYTGRFYAGIRTPVPLFEALATLKGEAPFRDAFEVVLVGPHADEYRGAARALGVDASITFQGRVPAAEAAARAASADVLLVIDAPSDRPSVFLPSKLVDYLAFRKPILGITPERGASAALLRELGCPVAAPNDTDAIAAALRDLASRWRNGTLAVGAGFDRVSAEFDIRCTARQLSDLLDAQASTPDSERLP